MATLYRSILINLFDDLKDTNPSLDLDFEIDPETIADKSYVKWEKDGGIDLQLPAFKLTNRQMFWLCYAHVNFHKKFSEIELITVKVNDGFREAYQCGEIPEDEQIEYIKKIFLHSLSNP